MRPSLAIVPAALAVLAVAGCGSSSSSSSNTNTSGSSPSSAGSSAGVTTAAATPAASSSGPAKITIQGFAFNPGQQTVKVGQKITWTNQDSTAHNVTGGPLRSATLNQGQSYSFTPTKPGTIQYVCTFHQGMTGTLTVTS